MIIRRAAYARMGLLGNPSDGFGGKTITVQIQDFAATMRLWESPRLEIKPHPVHDPSTFDSLEELHHTAQEDGYYGGTRLLYATCKRFYEYCADSGIALRDANFTIDYDTDIPRQVGLGGSSAIVVAALGCLMEFHGIGEEQIPLPQQPQLALAVELDELGIRAGLQDRVAQVYGGLVYMDFDEGHMRDLLPDLYLAWIPYSTATSGTAHNPIHFRYENGEAEVIAAMRQFAEFAELGRGAIERGDVGELGELMDRNFDLRRELYGDEVIGEQNLEMVELARGFGLPAKFTGSGGAVTGVLSSGAAVSDIREAFESRGYRFLVATPASNG
jgi:glucuronokinase